MITELTDSLLLSTDEDTKDNDIKTIILAKLENSYHNLHYFTMNELKELNNYYTEELAKYNAEKQMLLKAKTIITPVLKKNIHILRLKLLIVQTAMDYRAALSNKEGNVPIIIPHVEHPVFSATGNKSKKDNSIIFEKREGGYRVLYFNNPNGNLLTDYDNRVFSALCKLCEDKGYPKEMEVEFTQIFKILNTPYPSGGDYKNLEASLLELFHTTIVFEKQIRESSSKMDISYHHIIQHLSINSDDKKKAIVTFQDYVYDSLKQGEYFWVNMFLLNDMPSVLSRALYRFLLHEIKNNKQSIYTFDFDKLHQHLDHDRNNPARARKNLAKSFEDMKNYGIIKSYSLDKLGPSKYQFIVTPSDQNEHLSLL